MNVGATSGSVASAAGAPMSQLAGAESERAQKDASVERRGADANAKSERAAGIGEAEQDQGASDRDADGRKLWEAPVEVVREERHDEDAQPKQAKDTTGSMGGALDLTG